MQNAIFSIPFPKNEPVLEYRAGSSERKALQKAIKEFRSQETNVPMVIGGQKVETGDKMRLAPPHDHKHTLGYFHLGDKGHVEQAIKASLAAKTHWENLSWGERAAVFLRAADLIAGPFRAKINAATVLGQSKNAFQAEIDSACELIDFLRFNAYFMQEIYQNQPVSPTGVWNKMEYRPLEGFVFALTPFNFTAIAGNLPSSAALMGNVVVWKPAFTQILSAHVIMEVFQAAGLPDGVINLVFTNGPETGDVIFKHPDFAGIHFTGSTGVFQHIWKTIGENIHTYKSYPRIVGETGGKDFIVAHHSAKAKEVAVALVRGAFEFQGQKCSAASRAYLPQSLWKPVKKHILDILDDIKMGSPEEAGNFINAVIDEKAFDKISKYIDEAKIAKNVELIAGGNHDKSEGYFIEPTVLKVEDPKYKTMSEEIFGPVLTVYVYPDNDFEDILTLTDQTSPYALTGAIFAQDRYAIDLATDKLRHAAGNFYINDKPTGAVVGQQPFGGGRASGTNDKAGSYLNLLRWVSPRTIKETLNSPTDYKYPFLEKDKQNKTKKK